MNVKNLINSAIEFVKSGDMASAGDISKKIIAKDPKNVFASHMLGKLAIRDDRYSDAVKYLKLVYKSNSNNPEILHEYGSALRLSKRYKESIVVLRKSLALQPRQVVLLELGLSLADNQEYDEATCHLKKSLELNPKCIYSIRRLGSIARLQGNNGEAINYYKRIVDLWPNDVHAYPDIIKTNLLDGRPDMALHYCNKCLEIEPACTGVFAYKYVALSELDRFDEASYLFDFNNYIHMLEASCMAENYDTVESINDHLAEYIFNDTLKTKVPDLYTTVNGWQTQNGTLFDNDKELGTLFNKMIMDAVEKYISSIPGDPKHPVNISRPSKTHIESWAVVLSNNGHQAPHIHPKSWLSGCYYIKLPDDFYDHLNEKAGFIEFGQAEVGLHRKNIPTPVSYQPVEGSFVLFPSYFWHNTIPLVSDSHRICIAFDIVPTLGWGK